MISNGKCLQIACKQCYDCWITLFGIVTATDILFVYLNGAELRIGSVSLEGKPVTAALLPDGIRSIRDLITDSQYRFLGIHTAGAVRYRTFIFITIHGAILRINS